MTNLDETGAVFTTLLRLETEKNKRMSNIKKISPRCEAAVQTCVSYVFRSGICSMSTSSLVYNFLKMITMVRNCDFSEKREGTVIDVRSP